MSMSCISHVDVDSSDGKQCSFHRTLKPVARKEHLCCECRRTIKPGEQYLAESGMWDGGFYSHKTCADCWSMRCSFFGGGWYYGHIWEDLEEHIRECGGDVGEIHLACLNPVALGKVCALIEAQWEEEEDACA